MRAWQVCGSIIHGSTRGKATCCKAARVAKPPVAILYATACHPYDIQVPFCGLGGVCNQCHLACYLVSIMKDADPLPHIVQNGSQRTISKTRNTKYDGEGWQQSLRTGTAFYCPSEADSDLDQLPLFNYSTIVWILSLWWSWYR